MILAFADCQLDRSRRELRRSGQTIRVEPQVFDLIEMLVLNRSRVVSKDELFAAVWQAGADRLGGNLEQPAERSTARHRRQW